MFVECLKRFLRSESGVVSVEAIFWVPFFGALSILLVDATTIFNNHTHILRILQEGNRNRSVSYFETADEMKTWVEGQVSQYAASATVTVSEVYEDSSDTSTAYFVSTAVEVKAAELGMTGWFKMLHNATLTVSASHFIEY